MLLLVHMRSLVLLMITWYKTMLFSLKSFQMKNPKLVRAHHMGQFINHILLLTLVIQERSMYPPLVMNYQLCHVLQLYIDVCSTSMSYETNLLKETNELKNEVKNLSNKLERCYNSKVIFEHMLKTQRSYGDKCAVGFNKKSMPKGGRKRERKKKKKTRRGERARHPMQI